MITAPAQADHLIRTQQADVALLARVMLRDPYWPRRAAAELRQKIDVPLQYQRSWSRQVRSAAASRAVRYFVRTPPATARPPRPAHGGGDPHLRARARTPTPAQTGG